MANPLLFKLIDKCVYDYNLIQDGDRILVGASGGKDSMALIHYLSIFQKRKKPDFTFTCVNIQTEFGGPLPEGIMKCLKEWDVDLQVIDVDVQDRLKPGRKMSCYWCSTQRRVELIHYALEHGYNKIALGHHMDDVLETLFMNMLGKAEVSTMPPLFKYREYPLTLIRPLSYAVEDVIIDYAKENGYYGWTCTCNFQDNSTRKDARARLKALTDGDPIKKRHLYMALKNINTEYLP